VGPRVSESLPYAPPEFPPPPFSPFVLSLVRRVLAIVVFWSLAAFVALDDIDFFNPHDFFDLYHLHHEQIFGVLFVLGLVLALVPSAYLRLTARSVMFHGMWLAGGLLTYLTAAVLFEGGLGARLPTRLEYGIAFLAVILLLDVVGFLASRRIFAQRGWA
jgi:hypothetical protein